jgi:two-component system sensor histidine kinase KdpD
LNVVNTGIVSVLSRYLRGLGISAFCTALAYPLYPHFDPVNIVMLYLLGAALAGLALGRGPAALTAVTNAVAFDFFFVPPRYSFYISETQYLFTLGVMLIVTFVIANLMVSVRRQTEAAAERERRTGLLYAMSRELTVAADAMTVARAAERHVGSAVDGRAVVLLPNERGILSRGTAARTDDCAFDPVTAQRVFGHDRREIIGGGPDGIPQAAYLPLVCSGRVLGILFVQLEGCGAALAEPEGLLDALTRQIAMALERVRLADVAAASRAAAERAALRSTLLASISHDLRGPLSAIAGAGSLVAQNSDSLDRHRRKTLGHLIEEKARDMSGLLSNVLELMRLETFSGPVNADWQPLEDLVGIAIRNNEHRLGGRRISSAVAEDFPLVFVDAQLAVQLFSNLLDNAIKHTPPDTLIAIRAAVHDGRAVLTVEDNGPGFGTRDPERLFEKFERGRHETHVSGVGLGLAICRAIAHLHGGEIRARNGSLCGACFEFTFPLSPLPQTHGVAAMGSAERTQSVEHA